ncbi:hypothetical protein GQ53DRAFT_837528 [Thozetella sp. PMI_491]|nr:hypothetical protein GQ53DRAFT_837528 [Thozetella sp. PMI_491]
MAVASAHLDGLMAILDLAVSRMEREGKQETTSGIECLERCMVVSYIFISRLWENYAAPAGMRHEARAADSRHLHYRVNLDKKLQAIGLMPYFLNKWTPIMGPSMADISNFTTRTRLDTRGILSQDSSPLLPETDSTPKSEEIAINMAHGAAGLMSWLGGSHESSPKGAEQVQSDRMTPALPLYLAAELYYRRMLGRRIGKLGDAAEVTMQLQKFRILKRSIQRREAEMKAGTISRQLWFWHVFVCLMGHALFAYQTKTYLPSLRPDPAHRELHSFFIRSAREWIKVTGVGEWQVARGALVAETWPESPELFPHESLAKSLWAEAVNGVV